MSSAAVGAAEAFHRKIGYEKVGYRRQVRQGQSEFRDSNVLLTS